MEYKVLFVDDDANFVRAAADQVRGIAEARDVGFQLFTSVDELEHYLATMSGEQAVLTILDLWMIDKATNTPDREAGMRVLEMLRARWADIYVIIYSNHLDKEINRKLEAVNQIAIVDKTKAPLFVIADLVDSLLEEMKL